MSYIDDIDRAIASTHWEACETCLNLGNNGCELPDIDLTVHLGDWILCENYIQEVP